MELAKLRFQNRYWDKKEAIEEDIHLKCLKAAPLVLVHPIEKNLKLNEDRVYIIRGPRQVGKTTLLKRLIKKRLEKDIHPQRLFYFAFDIGNVKDDAEVAELIYTYVRFARKKFKEERLWLFLDEVTYTPNWALGVKKAYDSGILQNTTLILTGSSSLDLKRGGERLPGRRGIAAHENDLNMLPLSFRAYVENVYGLKELPLIKRADAKVIYEICQEVSYYQEEITHAFEEYLFCGGFPLSILALKEKEEINPSIYYTYLQAFLGDLTKAGKKEMYVREILHTIFQKHHEPVDWLLLAKESGIGSHHTVKDYIETLESLFILKVIYAIRTLGDNEISFKKRKKIYFYDPFLYAAFLSWVKGEIAPFKEIINLLQDTFYKAKLVENIVATVLSCRFDRIAYWRNKGEIDFIGLGKRNLPQYFEVKYQERITSEDKKQLKKVKGGVIVSKHTLSYDKENQIAIVPVGYFLSVL